MSTKTRATIEDLYKVEGKAAVSSVPTVGSVQKVTQIDHRRKRASSVANPAPSIANAGSVCSASRAFSVAVVAQPLPPLVHQAPQPPFSL